MTSGVGGVSCAPMRWGHQACSMHQNEGMGVTVSYGGTDRYAVKHRQAGFGTAYRASVASTRSSRSRHRRQTSNAAAASAAATERGTSLAK